MRALRRLSMRAFARLLLVMGLLAGWQAALQHPIEHDDAAGDLVHLHGDGHSDAGPLCDLLAALTACAPPAATPLLARDPVELQAALVSDCAPRPAEAPPFLSQGPPASV